MWRNRLFWCAACLVAAPACADLTHPASRIAPIRPGNPGMNEVNTDGGAQNFDDSSLIPAEWWHPRIEQNSPSTSRRSSSSRMGGGVAGT